MEKKEKYFCLVIIESLSETDIKTGTILQDELIKYKKFQEPNLESQLYCLDSKDELFRLFDKIIELQRDKGMFPYLHFEMHGYSNGLVLSNGEKAHWAEIMPYFHKMNLLAKNYLMLHLGSCYGMSIIGNIGVFDRAPFRMIIGAPKEIKVKHIEIGFGAYYDNYFFSFDPKESIEKLNKEINENIFFLVTIDYCFDKITEFDANTKKGKDQIHRMKERMENENVWLRSLPESEKLKIVENHLVKEYRELKSKKDYFLMNDLKL